MSDSPGELGGSTHIPVLSNTQQLAVMNLVKNGLSVDEACSRVQAMASAVSSTGIGIEQSQGDQSMETRKAHASPSVEVENEPEILASGVSDVTTVASLGLAKPAFYRGTSKRRTGKFHFESDDEDEEDPEEGQDGNWTEQSGLQMIQCVRFEPEPNGRCYCGLSMDEHHQ